MSLVLYYGPQNCSLVPFVALTEAGADFEVRLVNLEKKQQMTPEFLRLNPKHRVPVLLVDEEVVTENVAIQLWIAEQFPSARLLPERTFDKMRAVAILAWCASGIHPLLRRTRIPHTICDVPGTEDSTRRLAQNELFEVFGIANEMLAGREYFFDHFTTSDTHFFWCFRRAASFEIDVSRFGHCMAHFERMQQRASVQKVLAFEKEADAQLARPA